MSGEAKLRRRMSSDPPLPRGRHRMPREEVIAQQRDRLLRAVATEIREQGYTSLAVAEVVSRAGVSRRTFYQLFDDKLACVLAAHRAAAARIEWLISEAFVGQATWPEGVAASLGTVLRQGARAPDDLQLVLIGNSAISEPLFAPLNLTVQARAIASLRAVQGPEGIRPPEVAEQAAVGAVMAVIGSKLIAGEAERLPEYHPELVRLLLSPYLGDEEAKRIAAAA